MRTFGRVTSAAVAVVATLICVGSLLSDEPWTADHAIGTAIYAAVAAAGFVCWHVLRPRRG